MVSLGVDDGKVYFGLGGDAVRASNGKSKARGKVAAKGGALRAYLCLAAYGAGSQFQIEN